MEYICEPGHARRNEYSISNDNMMIYMMYSSNTLKLRSTVQKLFLLMKQKIIFRRDK